MNAVGVVAFFPLSLMLLLGGGGLPLSVPPLPEEPLLAKVAPEECLFYMSLAGVDEPDPQSKNQTEQLLAEPEVKHLISAVERAIVRAATMAGRPPAAATKKVERAPLRKVPRDIEKKPEEFSPPPLGPGDRGEPGRLGVEGAESGAGPESPAADAVKWGKLLLTRPLAVFVQSVTIGAQGPDVKGGAILNAGAEAANLKATLEKYQALLGVKAEQVQVDGLDCYRLNAGDGVPPVTWGMKGKTLLVGVGEGSLEGILKRAGGAPPEWLAALRKQLPVERVSTVTYVNVKQVIQQFAPMGGLRAGLVIRALGLSNLTSLASVTGLDAEGYVSRTLLGIEGEPAGVFRLAAAKPLTAQDLAPIPADATIAVAARLDAGDALATVVKLLGQIDPRAEKEMTQEMSRMQSALGIDLQEDLLKALGDTWCIYNAPSEGGFVVTGLTAVVSVKDHRRLAAVHQKLLAQAKAALEQEAQRSATGGFRRANPKIEQFQFAGQEIHFFTAGRFDDLPFAPSWCLTEKELILASYPQQIKAYLSRGANMRSLAARPEVAEAFEGGGPIGLVYVDTPKLFEVIYPILSISAHAMTTELQREGIDVNLSALPSYGTIARHLRPSIMVKRRTAAGIEVVSRGTVPLGNVGSYLPVMALFGVRSAPMLTPQAGRRAQSMNNLKQIALAMHNYAAAHNKFPPAYLADKNTGKPLLSWRVAILPFIEAAPLYEQFRLDEPWDSEHNKNLVAQMPEVYRSPASRAGPGMTTYLTARGKGTVFPGKEGVRFAEIRDGTSNTIMAVEASDAKAVPWTKPDDFEYDEKQPMAGLAGAWPGGFLAAMCDGSVHFLTTTIKPETLRRLFDRNDGQVIDREQWSEPGR